MRDINVKYAPKVAEIALALSNKISELEAINNSILREAIDAGCKENSVMYTMSLDAPSCNWDGPSLDDVGIFASGIYHRASELLPLPLPKAADVKEEKEEVKLTSSPA